MFFIHVFYIHEEAETQNLTSAFLTVTTLYSEWNKQWLIPQIDFLSDMLGDFCVFAAVSSAVLLWYHDASQYES